jgi:hypothetical protein
MTTPSRRSLLIGALIGAAISFAVFLAAQRAVQNGAGLEGVGFAVSHGLFIFTLPWSMPVLFAMWAVGAATGLDGPGFTAPWFYAMPIVAGACWGGVASMIRRAWSMRALTKGRAPAGVP